MAVGWGMHVVVMATRPFWREAGLYAALCGYTVVLLVTDARLTTVWPQFALAATAFALLFWLSRELGPDGRRELWCTIVVSLALELWGTQVWGLYGYRFLNVPPYVPPGHGLIFLACTRASRAGWVVRHERAFTRSVLGLATAWGLWGLVVAPALGGVRDWHGALYWPFFATLMTFSKRAGAHAWTFLVASALELFGTWLGTWHWAPVMPGLGLGAADPPSCVAGGYCFFAAAGVSWAEAWQRRRERRPVTAQPAS